MGLDFRKARRRFVEDRRVRFAFRKACSRLVEVQRVTFTNENGEGSLQMFGGSVLTTAKCVGGL